MAHLFVSWSDYHRATLNVAGAIYNSDWRFDHIVAVGRGGMRVGDVLSRLYRTPLAVLHSRSARADKRGEVTLSEHLAILEEKLGQRVLLVDDFVDSGATLSSAKRRLERECAAVRTAVLWLREGADFEPDYYVEVVAGDCRIHHPVEPYDLSNIAELGKRSAMETTTT